MHHPSLCSQATSCVFVSLALLVGTAIQGQAVALYTASASATITIDTISNLTTPGSLRGLAIIGDALVFDTETAASGNAFADASGDALVLGDPAALGGDDGVLLESLVTGDSVAGFATSFHFADGSLFFDNTSVDDTFEIALIFAYDLAVEAAVMAPLTETALASASVMIAAAGEFLVDTELLADSFLGGGTFLDSDAGLFTFVLAPGEFAEVAVFADALGSASSSPVPEPASLALFCTGLLALLALAYYRRSLSPLA